MKYLVGYNGFVGSNIARNMHFDGLFNHSNIEDAYNKRPDLLVYAGVSANKFLSNTNEAKDLETVMIAYENIIKIAPKKLVLISTIDANDITTGVDEMHISDLDNMQPYGKNRLILEQKIRKTFKDALIIRLPALFGMNIKKNFIYDLLNPVPKMLNKKAYDTYSTNATIKNSYYLLPNNFYGLSISADLNKLQDAFKTFNFSSVNFTDSNAQYQFYNLDNLAKDIKIALENNLKVLNINSEPVTAREICEHCLNRNFENNLGRIPVEYDVKTLYYKLFNGNNGYMYSKSTILEDLKHFLQFQQIKLSISDLAFNEEDIKDIIVLMKKYGFKALEIAPTKIVGENPYEKQEELIKYAYDLKHKFDISICSFQSIWYGISQTMFGKESDLDFLLKYTKQCIDSASGVGATNIVFGNPKSRYIYSKEDYETAKKFFTNLNGYAKEKGIVIALDPDPEIYGTNFLTTTEQAIAFVKDLGCENVKLNIDFGTIIQNNEKLNLVEQNINLINHVHISEPYLNLIKNNNKHRALFDILKAKNYKNYVSIEMKQQSIPDIEKTMKYLYNLLIQK